MARRIDPREIILVLDQSLSMSRKPNGVTLFDLQIEKAKAVLEKTHEHDSVRILLAGETPEWLTPEAIPAARRRYEAVGAARRPQADAGRRGPGRQRARSSRSRSTEG
jgi:uncharacterized protein (DUF58 family)